MIALINWSDLFQNAGLATGYILVGLLCLAGLILSCLTISGTWLVLLATILAAFLGGPHFPGWITIVLFLVLAIFVEIVEWLAGLWGVQKRGGSKLAGFAAIVGGILGLFLGTLIPIPILGSLFGMFAGSFALAYAVEHHRLKVSSQALHIAWGTVIARILVLLLKVVITLSMIAYLAIGIITS